MKEHVSYYTQAYLTNGGWSQITNPVLDRAQAEEVYERIEKQVPQQYSSVELIEVRERSIRSKHRAELHPTWKPLHTLETFHKVGIGDYLYDDGWGLSRIVQIMPHIQTSIPPHQERVTLTLFSQVHEREWTITTDWKTIHKMRDEVLKNPDFPDKY